LKQHEFEIDFNNANFEFEQIYNFIYNQHFMNIQLSLHKAYCEGFLSWVPFSIK